MILAMPLFDVSPEGRNLFKAMSGGRSFVAQVELRLGAIW